MKCFHFRLQILTQLYIDIHVFSIYTCFEFQLLQIHTHTFIPCHFLSEFAKMYRKVLGAWDISKSRPYVSTSGMLYLCAGIKAPCT